MVAILRYLVVPICTFDMWESRLEDASLTPAYQLIEFFRKIRETVSELEAFGLPQMATSNASSISHRILRHWTEVLRKIGYVSLRTVDYSELLELGALYESLYPE